MCPVPRTPFGCDSDDEEITSAGIVRCSSPLAVGALKWWPSSGSSLTTDYRTTFGRQLEYRRLLYSNVTTLAAEQGIRDQRVVAGSSCRVGGL